MNSQNLNQISRLWSFEDDVKSLKLDNTFILCTDSLQGSHDFTWTLLLFKMLKRNKSVTIISANHARDHYEQLLRRNGFDVPKLESSNRLQIHTLTDWDDINKFSPASNLACVFIDDLEAVEAVAAAPRYSRTMIASLFASLNSEPLEILVAFGRCSTEIVLEENDGEPTLTEYCKCRAHILVETEPLSSGRSSDAHGLITVTYIRDQLRLPQERYTFKATGSDGILCTSRD